MSVGGNKTGKLERDSRYRLNCKPVTLVRCRKSGEKNDSFDMNGRRMSASIISHVTSVTYGVTRRWRLFCARSAPPPPVAQNINPFPGQPGQRVFSFPVVCAREPTFAALSGQKRLTIGFCLHILKDILIWGCAPSIPGSAAGVARKPSALEELETWPR